MSVLVYLMYILFRFRICTILVGYLYVVNIHYLSSLLIRLHREVVDSTSLEILKDKQDRTLRNLIKL